jgi:arylsulfatase
MYDDGPSALRDKRLAKLREMGIISEDVIPHPVINPNTKSWDDQSEYERKCSSRAMEAYAGMVEEMDRNIGKVIDYLKATDQYDNTMIILMSDNGAEGAAYESIPVIGENTSKAVAKYYDNSLENNNELTGYPFTSTSPTWFFLISA